MAVRKKKRSRIGAARKLKGDGAVRLEKAADGPTPEQYQHGVYVNMPGKDVPQRKYNLAAWPPELLYMRYHRIDEGQYCACKQFSRDFTVAGFMPRVSLSAERGNGRAEMSTLQANAFMRWGDAYRAIPDEIGRKLAVDVICHGWTVAELFAPLQPKAVRQTGELTVKIYREPRELLPKFVEATEYLARFYKFNR